MWMSFHLLLPTGIFVMAPVTEDTAFSVSINLATKLQNSGKDVSFKLPWNRPHSGDYALNELFAWLAEIL